MTEVLFLSRRMYSEIQRTVNRSVISLGLVASSWLDATTNSSKLGPGTYGTKLILSVVLAILREIAQYK